MNGQSKINSYNITAQAYNLLDKDKQTLLINEIISAESKEEAIDKFTNETDLYKKILKIYSVEQI